MAKFSFKVQMVVEYESETATHQQIREILESSFRHMIENGGLSGHSDAEVTDYIFGIEPV